MNKKSEKVPLMIKYGQEEIIKNLTELYEREKQSRCYFQLERDKLVKMREIEKERFDELKAELFKANVKLADFEEWHNSEILNLKKKIKYLIAEREFKLNDLKLNLEVKDKVNVGLNLKETNYYLNGIRDSIKVLKEENLSLDETLKNLINENENQIYKLQLEYNETSKDIQSACEKRFNCERENFNLILRNTIHEITELKNKQISDIKAIKNKSFEDMKSFFKDLIQNLMSLVQNLNSNMKTYSFNLKDIEQKYSQARKELSKLSQENQTLKKENKSLNSKSNLYSLNLKSFKQKYNEFEILNKRYFDLDLKYEALLNIHENLKSENKRLETYIQNLIIKHKEKFLALNYISNKKKQFLQHQDLKI